MVCLAPRAPENIVRPRRPAGASVRPLNFTVRRARQSVEPPDTLEKGIRFGCGFLFGLLAAIGGGFVYLGWRAQYIAAGCLLGGLLCGYAAMRFGDRFWAGLSRWWWAPWW